MRTQAKNSRVEFSLHPLVWLAVCFALGILFQKSLQLSAAVIFAFVSASVLLSLVFMRCRSNVGFVFVSFVFAGALSLQAENSATAANRIKTLYDQNFYSSGEPVEIVGTVRGRPETTVGGFFFEVKAENLRYRQIEKQASGTIRVFASSISRETEIDYEILNLHDNLKLRFGCELLREEKFQNPGAISQKEILDQRQFDAVCNLKSPLLVEVLGEAQNFAPLSAVYEYRQNLIDEFRKRFTGSTAGVLIASLLGNRYYLDKNTAENFRDGGTFHIVVISGLQITFIGGLAILVVGSLTKKRWLQFLATTGFLWTYALAVGADAPVMRAALMFTVLHFASVIYRQGNLLNALGATVLLMLVWRPSDIFSQSFQLTLVCVTAIVAAAFPLIEKLRAVGEWQPTAETSLPPACSHNLKTFCETLYWSERKWIYQQKHSWWTGQLFKTVLATRLEKLKLQKLTRFVFESLLVSVIVQAWMIPLLIVYFHRISIVGIFLNVWVGAIIALESLVALTGIICARFSEVFALPFIKLTEILNFLLLNFSGWFVETDWASFRLPHYAGAGKVFYVLYYAPLIFLTYRVHSWQLFKPIEFKRNNAQAVTGKLGAIAKILSGDSRMLKLASLIFAGFLAVIIFHPFSEPKADGLLRVDFLDVGQGDAALVTFPNGELMLVDGGGQASFKTLRVAREGEPPEIFEPDAQSVGERVVSNFLWQKGYDRVDYILATHSDADHLQGLLAVAENFKIKAAFFGAAPTSDANYLELKGILEKKNIPAKMLSANETIDFGKVKIEILNPARREIGTEISDNNNSLVLRVSYGDRKILFTGDIESETENELTKKPTLLQADVVKVAHHGSRTSSTETFVNASPPKYAIISVGQQSPYGHPRPEIIERWKMAGAEVLTTGENGTISITTDGKNLELKTFLNPGIRR